MILLLCGAALALEPYANLGWESVGNDPFILRYGPRAGLGLELGEHLSVGASAGIYPYRPDAQWTTRTELLVSELRISPDLSPIMMRSSGLLNLHSAWSPFGQGWARAGLSLGAGMVYTEDDSEIVQVDPDDPQFASTANQVHPSLEMGLNAQVRVGHLGLQARAERSRYTEQVFTTTEERKNPWWVGLDLMLWLGSGPEQAPTPPAEP